MLVNAVISDIAVSNQAGTPGIHTLRALAETSAPAGYDGFRSFTPGYYNFQRAMIKHVVRSKTSVPILSGMVYIADMPDVLDKGRDSVTAGQLKQVLFNKRYVKPPEIGHSVLAMSEYAVVNITEITETGFIFCLLNSANQRVAGTISWTATGY